MLRTKKLSLFSILLCTCAYMLCSDERPNSMHIRHMQNMIAIFEKKQLREKGADREATIRTINEWNADLEKMKRQFPKL